MAIFNITKLLRKGEKRSTALGGIKKLLLSIIAPLLDLGVEAKERLKNYDAATAMVESKEFRRYEANSNSLYDMEKENSKVELKAISVQDKIDELVAEIATAANSLTPKQLRKVKSKLLKKKRLLVELEDIFDRTSARMEKLSDELEKADLNF